VAQGQMQEEGRRNLLSDNEGRQAKSACHQKEMNERKKPKKNARKRGEMSIKKGSAYFSKGEERRAALKKKGD